MCTDVPAARLSCVQMVASEEEMGCGGDVICVLRHTRACGTRDGELNLGFYGVQKSQNQLQSVLGVFWPPPDYYLGKGHARAQIIACQASRSTADKCDQFEIT